MKIISIVKLVPLVAGISLFAGCQKEFPSPSESVAVDDHEVAVYKVNKLTEHKVKGEYTSGYYAFVPDISAGYVAPYPAPGWYPGVATEGQLNLLGKSKAFVNMYVTMDASGNLHGIPASLNQALDLPPELAPLFDFTGMLGNLGITLPNNVAIVFFDKLGNSIWARGTGTIPVTPVSVTRVEFSGSNAEILGGTGKFTNATGSFSFSGYFNPQDPNDVGLELTRGTITY